MKMKTRARRTTKQQTETATHGNASTSEFGPTMRSAKRLRQAADRGQGSSVAAAAADTDPKHVTSLPREIIQKILGLVSTATLRNLRLASKITKKWIEEDANILARLPVQAKNQKDIKNFQKSEVKWNNLTLTSNFRSWHLVDVCPLLENLQPFLRRIKICNQMSCMAFFDLILELGPNVNSMSFAGNIDGSLEVLRSFTTKEAQSTLRKKLSKLKEFEIEAETESSVLTRLKFVWENLSNVNTMKVPFSMMRKFAPPPADTPGLELFCSEPMLTLLNAIGANHRRSEGLRIEFGKKWFFRQDSTDWAGFQQSDLNVVAELCRTNDVRLFNVPIQFLPLSQNLSKAQKLSLERSIGSILLKNEARGLGEYYVPDDCPVRISITNQLEHIPPPQRPDYSNFRLPEFGLNLISINWDINWATGGCLVDQLFKHLRTTVTELTFKEPGNPMFKHLKLSDVCPNLKKFHLSLGGAPLTHDPLCGLEELEEITLENCVLPKNCILKLNGEPSLLDLKKLKCLRILKCAINDWSDEELSRAFKFLKLESFVFTWSNRRYKKVLEITFHKGLKLLNTVDGGLKDTLESFECFAPVGTTDEAMNVFLGKFNKLRESTVHFLGASGKKRTVRQKH